jgi:uncharacterized membrane protein
VFRVLGLTDGQGYPIWHEILAYVLAVLFCFTGVIHFTRLRNDLEKMVPPWVANPGAMVLVTGILEILGAIGLLIHPTRVVTGVFLIIFLIAVFPANIYGTQKGVTLNKRPMPRMWIRAPIQLLLIVLVYWLIRY